MELILGSLDGDLLVYNHLHRVPSTSNTIPFRRIFSPFVALSFEDLSGAKLCLALDCGRFEPIVAPINLARLSDLVTCVIIGFRIHHDFKIDRKKDGFQELIETVTLTKCFKRTCQKWLASYQKTIGIGID